MATPDWFGFVENDKMKQVALDTLRDYGVGSCGPSGFYGTIGESACTCSARDA
jgi:serine palmitoyltransferase